ncbi:hypothetical protein [Streptomyces sp. MMBL 11-1]|uniref:hypothetical protein n=1 Tax=Streptomyces sp. MMBL 11-1 TaxID=3026420 RepID=UPI00235FDBF4|nr:hypothetical protein [Streptomyces sp. MMBL 11-1]
MSARVGMNYVDEHGNQQKLWESGAQKLAHVAENAPVGRLQAPGQWRVTAVRDFQDSGLWEVTWVEPGDTERVGGWIITGLTAKGRNLLSDWNRRVTVGGDRGPARKNRPGEAT